VLFLTLVAVGSAEMAEGYFARSEAAARSAPLDVMAEGWLVGMRALHAQIYEEDPWRALSLQEHAVTCLEEAGDTECAPLLRSMLGLACAELGAYDRAEAEIRRARSTLAMEPWFMGSRHVWVLADKGEVEAAVTTAGELLRGAPAQEGTPTVALTGVAEGFVRSVLAHALRLRGDVEGSAREAEASLSLPPLVPRQRDETLATLAAARLAQGRAAEALALAREAMRGQGLAALHEAFIRLVYVEALDAVGDRAGAEAALALARDRILAMAAKIEDAGLARSFLEDVADNARTLSLASARLGPLPR
jgi:tetratricopeptide (TPR) repeat protein